jgi:hypothetical protein
MSSDQDHIHELRIADLARKALIDHKPHFDGEVHEAGALERRSSRHGGAVANSGGDFATGKK